jgi:hypothetical protein
MILDDLQRNVTAAVEAFRAYLYERRLSKLLHLSGPPAWKVLVDSVMEVAIYLVIGALIAVLAFALALNLGSATPRVIGGIAMSTLAFVMSLLVNAEASFLDWLERFTYRLMPNELARISTGYTQVNRLIRKWRTTGAIFRNTVKIAAFLLFVMGVILSWP